MSARTRRREPLTCPVMVRLTEADRDRFAEQAARVNVTVPELLRMCTSHVLDITEMQEANRG